MMPEIIYESSRIRVVRNGDVNSEQYFTIEATVRFDAMGQPRWEQVLSGSLPVDSNRVYLDLPAGMPGATMAIIKAALLGFAEPHLTGAINVSQDPLFEAPGVKDGVSGGVLVAQEQS